MAGNRDKAKREHDRQQVAEMLLQGHPQNAIAKKLGVNPSTICRDVKSITQEWVENRLESAEIHRELECQRLDAMLLALWPKIEAGDVKSINAAIQISRTRCELLGLNMPIQVKVDALLQQSVNALLDGLSSVLPSEDYRRLLDAIVLIGKRQEAASRN